ncbi:hypothetical protein Aduo_009723 [Ancylostoma duodenale]
MDILTTIFTNATLLRVRDPSTLTMEDRQLHRALFHLAPPGIAERQQYLSFFYLPHVIKCLHGNTVADIELSQLQGTVNRVFTLATEAFDGTNGVWLPTHPLPKIRGELTALTYQVPLSPDLPGVYRPLEGYLRTEMRAPLKHPSAPLVEFETATHENVFAFEQILVGFPRLPPITYRATLEARTAFYTDHYDGPRKAKHRLTVYYAPVRIHRPSTPPK